MPILRIICLFSLIILIDTPRRVQADTPDFLTGEDYQQRLEDPGIASFSGLKLRESMHQIEQAYRLACFRDRLIDPEQTVELPKSNGDVRQLLISIGEAVDCRVSMTGHVAYFGPEHKTRLLRSLMFQRTLEFRQTLRDQPNRKLLVPQTLEWPILSRPRNLIVEVAEAADLRVTNAQLIDHDVWSAGTIPDANVPEILSILLLGFDLTFEISEDARSITLVPLPSAVELYHSEAYTLKTREQADGWQSVAPAAEITVRGRRVTVNGLVEDHEAISELRSGKRELDATAASASLPLSKRRFTLTLKDVPAAAVLKELQTSGIQFVWDQQQFVDAKIDVNSHVEIDVQEVTADEFFQALLGPLGIEFDVSGVTVTMRPKE